MSKTHLTRKRADLFPEQKSPVLGPFFLSFGPAPGVSETICFTAQGPGVIFGKSKPISARRQKGRPFPFPNRFSIPGDEKAGLSAVQGNLTPSRHKTKKGGNRPFSSERLPPHFHFQSPRISSRALSNATFKLFYIMLIISASRMDCCFFFFFFSFSLSVILPSPRF